MSTLILIIFIGGYLLIASEHLIKINKAATALITGVLCWVAYVVFSSDHHLVADQLTEHLGELSGILFFLLSAMTIVELIDQHDGFNIITERIRNRDKRRLLWIISFLTFFLSAILDNLTTTIVLISLLRKIMKDEKDRLYFAGIVIIAANAGGAWSPIGDVTTTMLWIGGQITAFKIITKLILPSLICLIVPLVLVSFRMKGTVERPEDLRTDGKALPVLHQKIILFSGIAVLISVPVFKTLTGLPPYMGILLGLGIIWIITEILHRSKDDEEKRSFTVVNALRKIDISTILFFLGILIAISAMQSTGILTKLSDSLAKSVNNQSVIVISIGLISSIVDNVPLVAAAQGMYDLVQYPTDHYFWEFLAYCAGTGGSALIIGSAAGVAAMGMEKINFFWYVKHITWLALLGFFSGAFFYILQDMVLK
ncbi:MAG TPA: sodium:proton antiporter NhaD [Bacteroidales bacterium]|nr:sodium:proton antiporter NhaD [Bacteroidales bacterium]